ncbi:MAG: dihydrodipicolinate synthase family protein [Lautropia sp.]
MASSSDRIPFAGVWPALLTPLDAARSIDIDLFASHAHALLAAGCGGLTPFGTTGEGPSFSVAERRDAIDGLLARGVPAQRLLVSTSCAALPDALALTRHAAEVGAFGALLMPPFFLKGVSDEGIVDALRWVIDPIRGSGLRIVLYHIPQVSGVALSHAVIRTLRDAYPDTIVGLKDSGCVRADSVAYARAFMPQMQVWVGNEPDLQTLGAMGSRGAVSGLANLVPRLVHRLVAGHDRPGAAADLAKVQALLGALEGYGLSAAIKGMLAVLSDDRRWLAVRPPLVALDERGYREIAGRVAALGIDRASD